MLQLELFPRMEFRSLSDFQRLESVSLPVSDKKKLINYPDFFLAPKINDVIKRQHANMVDKIIGFRMKYIEEMMVAQARGFEPEGSHETWGPSMHDGVQTWVGLDLQTLQTPYAEIMRIFHVLKLKPYQQIVDLGAAYGRMGIVVGGLHIKNSFIGFEYVKERVDEANRVYRDLGLRNAQMFTQDLFDPNFELPEADIYFIYDYGQVEHINHTLNQIREVSCKRPVKLVVRGKFTRKIIEAQHSWLELKYEGKTEELFSIYTAYLNQ